MRNTTLRYDGIKLILVWISGIVLAVAFVVWYAEENPIQEMPVEIRDVTVEDLELLIDRARVSGNIKLEAILHAVSGALETKTLAELADYTTKYNKHMLEDHYKSDVILKKLNTI